MKTVAIDQGTTSTRAIVFDVSGCSKILNAISHTQHHPQPGWVEHQPEELLNNIQRCLNSAGLETDIASIGIANQGESCLAWDSQTGAAIYPVIVWQDDRTKDWLEQRANNATREMIKQTAGLPLDAYFSASKLGWILRHIPEAKNLAAKGRLRLGTTDAFFRDRLCQRFETDVSTASRTSLMNLQTCQWDEKLCRFFGVPIECLPNITATSGDLGVLDCGHQRLPLTASIVDQQAALYGHGCRSTGSSKITFGTGAFALMLTGFRLLQNDAGSLPTVAWQLDGEKPTYALDGGVYAAASAVNWARSIGLFEHFAQINQFKRASAIETGLVFVPALAGLACPHWDRNARGAWLGLSLETKNTDMVQAILEGIAFRMAEVLGAMETLQKNQGAISIDGGMSTNPYFCQFLANTVNREISVSEQPELTATGTAVMASEITGTPIQLNTALTLIKPREKKSHYQNTFGAARSALQAFAAQIPSQNTRD